MLAMTVTAIVLNLFLLTLYLCARREARRQITRKEMMRLMCLTRLGDIITAHNKIPRALTVIQRHNRLVEAANSIRKAEEDIRNAD